MRHYPCAREACKGKYPERRRLEGRTYCSNLCYAVDTEMAYVERLCRESTAPEAEAEWTETWVSLVELADQLNRYRKVRKQASTAERKSVASVSG